MVKKKKKKKEEEEKSRQKNLFAGESEPIDSVSVSRAECSNH